MRDPGLKVPPLDPVRVNLGSIADAPPPYTGVFAAPGLDALYDKGTEGFWYLFFEDTVADGQTGDVSTPYLSFNGPQAPDIHVIAPGFVPILDGTGVHNVGTLSSTTMEAMTVFNLGQADLTVSNVQISNVSSNVGVIVTANPAGTIAPNLSANLGLAIAPTGGAFSFTVTITNDDPDENPYTFDVIGDTPVVPDLEVGDLQRDTILHNGGVDTIALPVALGETLGMVAAVDELNGWRLDNVGEVQLDVEASVTNPQGCAVQFTSPSEFAIPAMSADFLRLAIVPSATNYQFTIHLESTDPSEPIIDYTVFGKAVDKLAADNPNAALAAGANVFNLPADDFVEANPVVDAFGVWIKSINPRADTQYFLVPPDQAPIAPFDRLAPPPGVIDLGFIEIPTPNGVLVVPPADPFWEGLFTPDPAMLPPFNGIMLPPGPGLNGRLSSDPRGAYQLVVFQSGEVQDTDEVTEELVAWGLAFLVSDRFDTGDTGEIACVPIGDVVINEVGVRDGIGWVEIHNPNAFDVDLVDVALEAGGNGTYTSSAILNETLPAGGFLVVAGSDPGFADVVAPGLNIGSGKPDADSVRLLDCNADRIDTVTYGLPNSGGFVEDDDSVAFPVNAPEDAWQTAARRIDGLDTDRSRNDFRRTLDPTPGQANNIARFGVNPPLHEATGSVSFRAIQMQPGERIAVFASLNTGTTPLTQNLSLGLRNPVLLGFATADANGVAELIVAIPPTLPPTVHAQGVLITGTGPVLTQRITEQR